MAGESAKDVLGEGKDGRMEENKSIKKRRNSAKQTENRAYILNAGILDGKRGSAWTSHMSLLQQYVDDCETSTAGVSGSVVLYLLKRLDVFGKI